MHAAAPLQSMVLFYEGRQGGGRGATAAGHARATVDRTAQ